MCSLISYFFVGSQSVTLSHSAIREGKNLQEWNLISKNVKRQQPGATMKGENHTFCVLRSYRERSILCVHKFTGMQK